MLSTYKGNNYKLLAVKYYLLTNKSHIEICKMFKCNLKNLIKWVEKYKKKEHAMTKIKSKNIDNKIITYKNNISEQSPPIAKIIPKQLRKFNDIRIDDYYWLNNINNKSVVNYLNKENEYYYSQTYHTKILQNKILNNIKINSGKYNLSTYYIDNGYYYFSVFKVGNDYPIYFRKKEDTYNYTFILDCNKFAKKFEYFHIGKLYASPNNKYIAFGIDTTGSGIYTILIKNIIIGEIINDKINYTTGNVVWANDSNTLFYTKIDDITMISNKIFKHTLMTNHNDDVLIYSENDNTYFTEVSKDKSNQYIIINSTNSITNEIRLLSANNIDDNFIIFQKRVNGLLYSINYYNDYFYILTNKDNAYNFKLMKTHISSTSRKYWIDVIQHNTNNIIEDFHIFKQFLVIVERHNGLNVINIMSWDKNYKYYIRFKCETYAINITEYNNYDSDILCFYYESMTTPKILINFNMIKQTVNNNHIHVDIAHDYVELIINNNSNKYIEERIWATATDGKKIPISLVYKKRIKKNGQAPLLLYGFGAYGGYTTEYFSLNVLNLLEYGFIYGIAHIRGDSYLGKKWYENGKLLKKKNTFTDFIDCSKYLIENNYTSPSHLYAKSWSAGGVLMGAIANIAPQLYNGIIMNSPFVDVLTTMLDDTIPLTTIEYDEWGNPNYKKYYNYIKSYSPYDNIKAQHYPSIYITAGLHDKTVQYWESAKYVAKLRSHKTDNNHIYLNTNMNSGHHGVSGRFKIMKEFVKELCFLLNLENQI